jgi:tRNA G18 (ribose-2'-O)-methylase SpoU
MPAFDPWTPFRDLRFAGTREHPEAGPCFIAEGRILVDDLLSSASRGGPRVISVAATPAAAEGLRGRLPAATELLVAEASRLSDLAGFPFHRGVLACAAVPPSPPEESLLRTRRLLVLPRLHDCENLGLLLRSAAALGLEGVLVGPGPGLWSRRTVRVSMGAVWRIPVWRREDPWEALGHWRTQAAGSEVVAAALVSEAEDARSWRPAPRCALVMGPEDTGLAPDLVARCDLAVAIPMASGMDSLNVAAAGAILMFRMMDLADSS